MATKAHAEPGPTQPPRRRGTEKHYQGEFLGIAVSLRLRAARLHEDRTVHAFGGTAHSAFVV